MLYNPALPFLAASQMMTMATSLMATSWRTAQAFPTPFLLPAQPKRPAPVTSFWPVAGSFNGHGATSAGTELLETMMAVPRAAMEAQAKAFAPGMAMWPWLQSPAASAAPGSFGFGAASWMMPHGGIGRPASPFDAMSKFWMDAAMANMAAMQRQAQTAMTERAIEAMFSAFMPGAARSRPAAFDMMAWMQPMSAWRH